MRRSNKNQRTAGTFRQVVSLRSRSRIGAVAAELATVLPLLCLITFGSIQVANTIHFKQALTSAAFEGTRIASGVTANRTTMEARVQAMLDARHVVGATITITPAGDLLLTPSGTPITITITAPIAGNVTGPSFVQFSTQSLSSVKPFINDSLIRGLAPFLLPKRFTNMRPNHSRNHAITKTRRGAIIVLVALLLPAFLLIVGFSIDLAHIQLSRTEMRLAVDAAARAAAEELSRTESLTSARNRAIAVAAMNPVAGNTLSLSNTDVKFGRSVQTSNGTWNFTLNQTPSNAVQIVGLRTTAAIDGQLNLMLGWYSSRTALDLTVPAVSAFRTTDIGLVLDRSTSMKQSCTSNPGQSYNARFCQPPFSDSGWTALDAAVDVFLNEVASTPAEERVSVVTFASVISSSYCGAKPAATLDRTLTSSVSAVQSAMNVLASTVWNGNTNIAAGIDLSRQELINGSNARSLADKFMLLMTDGDANEGNTIASATAAAAQGIKISTVTFGVDSNQTAMQQVAAIGGGVHYHASTAAELTEVFRKFAAQTALIVQ